MNTTENPPTPPLDSREAMLETLCMAYQYILDQFACDFELQPRRMTTEEQRELGRRLAEYWQIKNTIS